MNADFLRFYIRQVIREVQDNARVPDQLRSPKGKVNPDKKEKHSSADKDPHKDEMDEMSVAGNIAGMTLPLGMSPGDPSLTGTPRKKRKLKHSWK